MLNINSKNETMKLETKIDSDSGRNCCCSFRYVYHPAGNRKLKVNRQRTKKDPKIKEKFLFNNISVQIEDNETRFESFVKRDKFKSGTQKTTKT